MFSQRIQFTFTTTLERAESDVEVHVRCLAAPYADSRGIPAEFRERFIGRYDVEVLEVLDDAGKDVELVGEERDALQDRAIDQFLHY